jgi:tetratricopeptide (TPR) repeat protein
LAGSYSAIGDAQAQDGNFAGMLEAYKKVLSMNQAAASADAKNQQAQDDLALAYDGVGYAQYALERFPEAKVNLAAARDIAEKLATSDSTNADMKHLWAFSEVDLGYLEERSGAIASAMKRYQLALNIWQALASAAPADMDSALRLASIENRIGRALNKTGHLDDAINYQRKALAQAESLAAQHPGDEGPTYVVADSFAALGDAFAQMAEQAKGKKNIELWHEARSDYSQSEQAWRKTHNPHTVSPAGFEMLGPQAAAAGLARCDAALAETSGILSRMSQ